jgi:UDP-N-acetylglucosamine acyltransferase
MIVDGNPASVRGVNVVGLERRDIAPEARKLLKQVYKALYREGLSTSQAVEKIRSEITGNPEVDHVISFIENSKRGIIK